MEPKQDGAAAAGRGRERRRVRRRLRAGVLGGVLGLLLGAGTAAAPASAEEFSFLALNRTYSDLVEELEPIQVGPARVLVRTPDHVLRLVSHRAVLSPSPLGGLEVVVTAEFQGSGRIEADVTMTGVDTTVVDTLVVPRQQVVVRGRVSVAAAADGFVVRPLELQPSIRVQIESELASRLFSICRPMGLVLVSLDCREMERSLSDLEVPLPRDRSYFLEYSELSAEELSALRRFLDRAELP